VDNKHKPLDTSQETEYKMFGLEFQISPVFISPRNRVAQLYLALQVGGVSNETVKYGREFCGTSTQE
jgi:hypothetical protein